MSVYRDKVYTLKIIEIKERIPMKDKHGKKIGHTNNLLEYGMAIEEKIGNTKRLSYLKGDTIKELMNKFLFKEGFKTKLIDKIRKWLRKI